MKCTVLLNFVFVVGSFARTQVLPSSKYLPPLETSTGSNLLSPVISRSSSENILTAPELPLLPPLNPPVIPSGSYLPSDNSDEKDAYFFSTPDEEESVLQIRVAPKNRKKTNLVFVKAPAPSLIKPEVLNLPSSSEVKTIVYLLVKKTPQTQPINIPAQVNQVASKPEIIFVKYNNVEDAERAIQQSLAGQSEQPTAQSTNQQVFLKDIRTSLESSSSIEEGYPASGANLLSPFVKGNNKGESTNGNLLQAGDSPSGISGGSSGISITSQERETTAVKYGPPGASGPY